MPANRLYRRRLLGVAAAVAGLVIAAQIASAIHPRPKAASPIRASLVPSYEPCTAPNSTHGPPLRFPSCTPPVPTSDYLTVGTPDANGAAANSSGFVRIAVHVGNPGPPEDSMVDIRGEITDVRCQTGVNTTCGNANNAGGPDYTGQLEGTMTLRITDHFNGPGNDQAATMVDVPQPIQLFCAATADPAIGSTCKFPVLTCDSCPPPKEGVRTVVEVSQIQVKDGGEDGYAPTPDNTLFAVQGVFLP